MNNQQKFYSGKKQMHSFSILLSCLPNGKITTLSHSLHGSIGDMGACHLNEQHQVLWSRLLKSDGIAVDQGFVGLENIGTHA